MLVPGAACSDPALTLMPALVFENLDLGHFFSKRGGRMHRQSTQIDREQKGSMDDDHI